MRVSAPERRRLNAAESFRSAAEAIGEVCAGMAPVFRLTRGQWSMVDAILHVLDQLGPSEISLWTWTVADYEVEVFRALASDGRVTGGRLVIDYGARQKNLGLISGWRERFGPESVRYVLNHAKIATVTGGGARVCLRGSMNLNFNPRFEQLDISEGDDAYDLVREVEATFPVLADDCTGGEVYAASKVGEAFEPERLAMFSSLRRWAK